MSTAAPSMTPFPLSPRRALLIDVSAIPPGGMTDSDRALAESLTLFDLIYRTLCAILYNYVPTSGHPGGSASSGRIVASLLFDAMDYDFSDPEKPGADLISYAAGHKAMGLYAMWALRNEVVRVGAPDLLPDPRMQLRLEDLLGFRRSPRTETPLFRRFGSRPLDGHPTPLVPFLRLSTGASGVGVPSSLGLALAAMDLYGRGSARDPGGRDSVPKVHIIEGEGGMTAGRVSEAMAMAATACLGNAVMHLDWNQASIDSDCVCADGGRPGDYVQWNPAEFAYLHDWNVIRVQDGSDLQQVLVAQRLAAEVMNDQPTCIVYRTVKGWRYGLEGRGSHGAGHRFCSEEFYASLRPFEDEFGAAFPRFECKRTPERVEQAFWETLVVVRQAVELRMDWASGLAARLGESRRRLESRGRAIAGDRPDSSLLYSDAIRADDTPVELRLEPGSGTTLRAALGDALNHLNRHCRGAILATAADLCGSTSIANVNKGYPSGFYNAVDNPGSRLIACGGICEDAMGALMTGVSAYGRHAGAASSYGAFIAPLQHVAARLHAIGQQNRMELTGEPYNPFIMICAHAGLKTGEDGPTHADPQPLQLLQENFPPGAAITLTPWEPQEVWPLLVAALKARPAVIAAFVTRPEEKVPDRRALALPPASEAARGICAWRQADAGRRPYHGTIVLQGSGVAYEFADVVLPEIGRQGLNMNVFCISSVELFLMMPQERREEIFPAALAGEAMGITDFTLPTLFRWVASEQGRERSLHPFRSGRYPGSGTAHAVMREAGLDGCSQLNAVLAYAEACERRAGPHDIA